MGQPIERSSIRVVPWARGFRELQHGPNRMLFVTTRTVEREAQFLWAGPVTVDYFALIANRSKKLRITQIDQLKNLRIGLVRDDVAEDMLEKLDIDQKLITKSNESVGVAKMLVADRVDLWPIDPRGARTILKSIGANPDEYEVVANLSPGPLYYAFSKDVDPTLVAEFQQAIDELRVKRPELFPSGHADVGAGDIPTLQ
jgi:polar amino acid transport system substrate-binding protein